MTRGLVKSVNVGPTKRAPFDGPRAETAIDKRPLRSAAHVHTGGVAGDEQADRIHHGGPDQAVYAYAYEDLVWWSERLGRQLPVGAFGENISTSGLDVNNCLIGETWHIGGVLAQITSPRIPCRNFAGWLAEEQWIKRFAEAGRPGAYLRVLRPGQLSAGNEISVVERPATSISVADALRVYYGDWDLLPRLVDAPGLAARWAAMARSRTTDRTLSRLPDNPLDSVEARL